MTDREAIRELIWTIRKEFGDCMWPDTKKAVEHLEANFLKDSK